MIRTPLAMNKTLTVSKRYVGPAMDPLIVFLKDFFFLKKVILKKSQQTRKNHEKLLNLQINKIKFIFTLPLIRTLKRGGACRIQSHV